MAGNAENHKSPEESTKTSVTDVDTPIDCQIKTKFAFQQFMIKQVKRNVKAVCCAQYNSTTNK